MWFSRILMLLCLLQGTAQAGEAINLASPELRSGGRSLFTANLEVPGPGMFLVARRGLEDPRFRQSVIFLVTHGAGGTLGLIVNRPGDINLAKAVPDLDAEQAAGYKLYFGGPVGLPMILMMARGESLAEGMEHIADDVYISSELPVLEAALAATQPGHKLRFYIGYSGWGAGQLDFELSLDSWHVVAADIDAIFADETDSLWPRLIERLEPIGIQAESRTGSPAFASVDSSGLHFPSIMTLRR